MPNLNEDIFIDIQDASYYSMKPEKQISGQQLQWDSMTRLLLELRSLPYALFSNEYDAAYSSVSRCFINEIMCGQD